MEYKQEFNIFLFKFWGDALDKIENADYDEMRTVENIIEDYFEDEIPTPEEINDFISSADFCFFDYDDDDYDDGYDEDDEDCDEEDDGEEDDDEDCDDDDCDDDEDYDDYDED